MQPAPRVPGILAGGARWRMRQLATPIQASAQPPPPPPKRRPRRAGSGRKRPTGSRTGGSAAPGPAPSEADLVRELNAAHTWMPQEEGQSGGEGLLLDGQEFGLEDVAAHAARHEAQRRPGGAALAGGAAGGRLPYSAMKSEDEGAGGGGGGAQQQMPGWVDDLQAAGFDMFVSGGGGGGGKGGGEVFLQRLSRPPARRKRPPSDAAGGQAAAGAAAARRAGGSAASTATSQPAAAGPQPVPSATLAAAFEVRASEFAPSCWPHPPTATLQGRGAAPPTARGAAASLAPPRGDAAWLSAVGLDAESAAAAAPADVPLLGGPEAVMYELLSARHPDELLRWLDAAFPAWSGGGCRLIHGGQRVPLDCPTPGEAATALKGLALAARRAGFNTVQRMSLVRGFACGGPLAQQQGI